MRLLAKFVENTYEKVDRLLDLREGAVNRLAVVDKEIEQEIRGQCRVPCMLAFDVFTLLQR